MLTTLSKGTWDLLWRLWYPLVTRLSRKASVTFLNYGYEEGGTNPLVLEPQDEPDRPCIQLYHRVACAIDLRGADVLEVSCGHGGGASYVARYLHPKSMHGMDRNSRAVALCKGRHAVEGLSFSQGNAMALGFDDRTFDVLINVEASHCYPDIQRFFGEVHRVLRAGGHFLYADFRHGNRARALLESQLQQSGLQIIAAEDISPGVVRGMQMNTEKYEHLIRKLVPAFLRGPAMGFAGVKGSTIYNALESGETTYLCYQLRKSN